METNGEEYAEPRGTVEETERYTTQHIMSIESFAYLTVRIWLKANACATKKECCLKDTDAGLIARRFPFLTGGDPSAVLLHGEVSQGESEKPVQLLQASDKGSLSRRLEDKAPLLRRGSGAPVPTFRPTGGFDAKGDDPVAVQ